jgi:hypothetical protein
VTSTKPPADNITPPSQLSPHDIFGSDEEEEPFGEQEPIGQEPEEDEPERDESYINDFIKGIDERKVAKDPSFSVKSVHPFKIIEYDKDGLKRINPEFAVSNLYQDLYLPQILTRQCAFLLGIRVPYYFVDPEDVLYIHNDKNITKADHL